MKELGKVYPIILSLYQCRNASKSIEYNRRSIVDFGDLFEIDFGVQLSIYQIQ